MDALAGIATIDTVAGLAAAIGLVVLSAFFSGTEVALFALRRIDREQMARSGRPVDTLVLQLLEKPRRLIATVLVGNEAVTGLLGVVVFEAVVRVTLLLPVWAAALALAIALPLVLLLGDVFAKTLALKAPIAWARATARPLATFSLVIAPARFAVQVIAELLLKPFGDAARARPARDLSEEEFRKLVDAGSAQGQVDARERRLIHRVFEFSDKSVGQIMTPRDKMFGLSFDLPSARIVREVAARGFSRVPIYQRTHDNIRGILNAKDLLSVVAGGGPAPRLATLLHEPLFVPRATPVKRLFRTFKQKKVHMALVVNEYGKVLGLVTMDDVLAQLFGKLRDEREGLQSASRRGRGGRTPVPGVPTVPAPEDGMQESVSRGEDAAPVERGDDEVTPPAIDLPIDLPPMERHAMARPLAEDPALDPVESDHDDRDDRHRDDRDRDRDYRDRDHDDDGLAGARDAGGADGDRELAGSGEPGVPIPVTDVATGPSGPIATGRTGRRNTGRVDPDGGSS